jgi:hypothetical protein
VRLSCLARNGRSPGEESLTAVIAAQAIEAQPSFGQIKPSEAAWLAGPSALRRRRGGYCITCTRGQPRRATEKKPWRTDGSATARHDLGHTALPSRAVSHPARDAVSVPSERCDDRPTVTRRRSEIGSAIQPLRRRTAGSTLLGHRRQRNRHAGGDALSGIGRGREGHAHPGRSRHDNCANHCDCLLPAIGGYTDVRDAERGMIPRDGTRDCEKECCWRARQ